MNTKRRLYEGTVLVTVLNVDYQSNREKGERN